MSGKRTQAIVVATSEWVRADQVEMVGQADNVAGSVVGMDATCRGGEDQGLHAEGSHHPDGEGHGLEVVPLIVVKPALQGGDPGRAEGTDDQVPSVAVDGRGGEVRDLRVRDRDGIFQAIGQDAEAGAEHDGDARRSLDLSLRMCGGLDSVE